MIATLIILKAKNKAHSSILHSGKPTQHIVWHSIKQSITVVQMAQNHRMKKLNFEFFFTDSLDAILTKFLRLL